MLNKRYEEFKAECFGTGTSYMNKKHKQFKYLYRQMLDEAIIRKAYKKLRKGKTKRKEIQQIDANLDEEVKKMRVMIENTRPDAEHPELGFKPPKKRKPKIINEHGKPRIIYMPEIREQWLHHIIVLILSPIILSTSYAISCGSFPKRGAHYGMRYLRKMIKRGRNIKYFAKLDIRHFYNSIRVKMLMDSLRDMIKDELFLYVVELCLKGFVKGIPLGFYISQWLANYFLEPLDRLIKEVCGIEINVRYMDDLLLMDDNKKVLHKTIKKIMHLLGSLLRLKLKNNFQVIRFAYTKKDGKKIGRPIDIMGFVFYRDGKVIMRERIMLHITRLARHMAKVKERTGKYYTTHIRAILSGMGWFKYTDSYGCFLDHIKPFVKIKVLRGIISRIDRRERKHDRLDRGALCAAS